MAKGFLHVKKYGLIYARVPKVANSSIKTVLAGLVEVTPKENLRPTNDRFWRICTEDAHYMAPDRFTNLYKDKFSFTVIRDPLDRMFSCYINKIIVDGATDAFRSRGYSTDMSFDDFVAHTCSMQVADMDVHTQPQDFLITDVSGRLPKFVGLLENLDRDWAYLLEEFAKKDIPIQGPLPVINSRKKARENVSNALGDETRKRFNWVYGPCIELHNRLSKDRGLETGSSSAS